VTAKIPDNLQSLAAADLDFLDGSARQAAEQFLEQGTPANTVRSYAAAFRYLQAWYGLRFGLDMSQAPMPVAAAVQFVLDHLPREDEDGAQAVELPSSIDEHLVRLGAKKQPGALKTNTVIHRLSVLGKYHRLRDWESPTDDARYRTLLRSARNTQVNAGERITRKTAATADPLQAMLATCDDGMRGLRDRALLLLAWSSGGRRRSELTAIKAEDLVGQVNGDYVLTMGLSKTERDGQQRAKPVRGEAADALRDWFQASGIRQGPLFVRIHRNGQPGSNALSDNHVALIVKRRALLAGLPGDWAGHSLRSGFITEAGRQNMAIPDVMAMTDHRSVNTLMGYYQAGELLRAQVGNLLASAQHEPTEQNTN
jgi:integrase